MRQAPRVDDDGRGLSLAQIRRRWYTVVRLPRRAIAADRRHDRGAMLFRVGLPECLIILVVLLIVAGLAYRGGYYRARRRK